MPKVLKPGQLFTRGTVQYRVKKREYSSCRGCDLDTINLCPNIVGRGEEKPYDCETYQIILKRMSLSH